MIPIRDYRANPSRVRCCPERRYTASGRLGRKMPSRLFYLNELLCLQLTTTGYSETEKKKKPIS